MKKSILLITALLGAMGWTGCQQIQEELIEEKPEMAQVEKAEHDAAANTYSITIRAERIPDQAGNDGVQTKGLTVEGEEATTTQLNSVWKAGEEVKVYREGAYIGTLIATPDGENPHLATLNGEINPYEITANSTTLTLLTPRSIWDYTGQVGKLLISDDATDSIEKKFHYTMATDVLVTAVDGWNVATEDAHFTNQQSIYRLSFKYDSSSITAKSITISSANGHLVQSQTVGGAATEGDISVTLGTATTDPFFVALRNGDETNAEVLTFTVVDDNGITYRGTKEIPAAAKGNGKFVSVKNANLTERLDLVLSATTVNTVL